MMARVVVLNATRKKHLISWTHPIINGPAIPHMLQIFLAKPEKAIWALTHIAALLSPSRRLACWSCHAGYGKTPTGAKNIEQAKNIDCLVCHSQDYKRKAVPPYHNSDINMDRLVDMTDFSLLSMEWMNNNCNEVTGCNFTDLYGDGQINIIDLQFFANEWLGCTDPSGSCNYSWTETLKYTDYQGITRTWTLPKENENGDFQYGPR